MEEQLCESCEIANTYVQVINKSNSDEELFNILHDLIELVRTDAQLEIAEYQADLWKEAKYELMKRLED